MQVQNIQNNNPNFEAKFTKKSIKFLKKSLPEITKGEDYKATKEAFENLLQAKKRNDNILIDLHKDINGYNLVDYSVRYIRGKSKTFLYPVVTPIKYSTQTNAQKFLVDAKYINSEDFIKESNRVIDVYNKRQANLPMWKKVEESLANQIKTLSDFIGEKADKIICKLIEIEKNYKEKTPQKSFKIAFSKENKEKIESLNKLINELAK